MLSCGERTWRALIVGGFVSSVKTAFSPLAIAPIVIDDPQALPISVLDVPKPQILVDREARSPSGENTPLKVRHDVNELEAVTIDGTHVQKETKGKDVDVSSIREKHARDQASTR